MNQTQHTNQVQYTKRTPISEDVRRIAVEKVLKPTFNRGLFALAFLQAYIFLSYHSSILMPLSFSDYGLMYAISILAAIITLTVNLCMPLSRRIRVIMFVVSSLFSSVSIIALRFFGTEETIRLLVIASVLLGVNIGLAISFIGKIFAQKTLAKAARDTFGAFFFATILYFIIATVSSQINIFFMALLPIGMLASVLFDARDRRGLKAEKNDEIRTILLSRPIKGFYVGVAILGLVFGFVMSYCAAHGSQVVDTANAWAIVLLALVAVAYLVIIVLTRINFDFEWFFAPVIPVLIAGFLLMNREFTVSCILVILGYQLSDMVIWVICSWIGSHSGIPQQPFCVMKISLFAGMLIGVFVNEGAGHLAFDMSFIETLILVVVTVLVFVAICIFSNSHVVAAIKSSTQSEIVNSIHKAVWHRCDEIGKRYKLSLREKEVLYYLVQGRSLPYVEEQLTISRSTVNSHRDHIYTKLDIHAKQELLNLFYAED